MKGFYCLDLKFIIYDTQETIYNKGTVWFWLQIKLKDKLPSHIKQVNRGKRKPEGKEEKKKKVAQMETVIIIPVKICNILPFWQYLKTPHETEGRVKNMLSQYLRVFM